MNFYQTTGFCSAEEQEAGITVDVNKGPWTAEEDSMLMNYVTIHGEGRWNSVAQKAGLKRTGKSCRLRWLNYLRPDLLRGDMSPQEQLLILELHSRWGNKWSKMAHYLPGRTDNEIKNYWRTRVQKQAKLLQCDVNSKKFRAAVKYVWMPRLREKITSTMVTQFDHVDQMRQRQQGFAVPDSSNFLPDEMSVSDSDKSNFRLISELFDDGYDNDQAIQISQPLLDASDLSRFIAVPLENSSSTSDNSSFSHETLVSDLSEGYEYNQWVPEYEDGNTWAGVACEGGDHDLLMTMDDWWSEESMRFLQEQLSDGGF